MRRAPQQCAALTKATKRCSITVDSKLLTESGKLAAGPLVRGGRYCFFFPHAGVQWSTRAGPARREGLLPRLRGHRLSGTQISPSTHNVAGCPPSFHFRGLDVLSHAIVEIGLLDEITSAVFSAVVRPTVLPSEDERPAVHGISAQELTDGPVFGETFRQLVLGGERRGSANGGLSKITKV